MSEFDKTNPSEEKECTIVMFRDDEGNELSFEYLTDVEYEGEVYKVMIPIEEDEAEDVLNLLICQSEDDESYIIIEDPEIIDAVFEIVKDEFEDEFNFID